MTTSLTPSFKRRKRPELYLDAYKSGHGPQYPEGTELVYTNATARSMKRFPIPDVENTIHFGLTGAIKRVFIEDWQEGFFSQPVEEVITHYQRRMDGALGAGAVKSDHIRALHKLGFLPVCIKALPEGSLVPTRIPYFTIYNTRPEFAWLTNYLETQLSAETWKSPVSATIAYEFRKLFMTMAIATGAPLEFTLWQGHDFSMRGMSGVPDAMYYTGPSHLTSFLGTDTFPALDFLEDYYHGLETFLGGSVPATEHSVMTAGGKESELETYSRLLDMYPKGVVSIVSDTWDYWNVLTVTAVALKDKIMSREKDANGLCKTVFRPDSGDPVKVICGEAYPVIDLQPATFKAVLEEGYTKVWDSTSNLYYQIQVSDWTEGLGLSKTDRPVVGYKAVLIENPSPADKGSVQVLYDIFGGTVNERGFMTLDEHVGLIYGDGITYERAAKILILLAKKNFASNNIVFGLGSFTYQYVTRDSIGEAFKATYVEINGVGQAMVKDPATDDGTKKSASGLLRVEVDEEKLFVLHENQTWEQEAQGALQTVFLDGQIYPAGEETVVGIRARIEANLQRELKEHIEDVDHYYEFVKQLDTLNEDVSGLLKEAEDVLSKVGSQIEEVKDENVHLVKKILLTDQTVDEQVAAGDMPSESNGTDPA